VPNHGTRRFRVADGDSLENVGSHNGSSGPSCKRMAFGRRCRVRWLTKVLRKIKGSMCSSLKGFVKGRQSSSMLVLTNIGSERIGVPFHEVIRWKLSLRLLTLGLTTPSLWAPLSAYLVSVHVGGTYFLNQSI
jgi:hypothetical protein